MERITSGGIPQAKAWLALLSMALRAAPWAWSMLLLNRVAKMIEAPSPKPRTYRFRPAYSI
ncbi:MAG: hypothetical protein KF820_03040 [Candidatus Paracaedibacteraceae bacterium]|nr:hypothetical protein [Candidatus Paracaedibacteraceae bacterium]